MLLRFRERKMIPLRITIIYTIVGLLWILFSDALVLAITRDPAVFTLLQTIKGFLFVFVTASVLYLLISRNVARIQRSEQALADSEAKYRGLVEATSDWIWETDESRAFTYTNQNIYDILGYKPEEIIGKTPYEFMTEEEVGRMTKVFDDIRAAQEPFRLLETTLLHKNGTAIILEVSGAPVFYDKGNFLGYRGIARDITERKQVEKALKERDRAIRMAYVDVFSAVTGDRLIIMTDDEIEASLGEPITEPSRFKSFEELASARVILKQAIESQFAGMEDVDDFIVAANEAIANAVKHAGGGTYQVFKKGETTQILISDSGPGIDFKTLPRATLLAGFSTKQSLGMGFSLMLELCDRVLLATRPGGTTIVLEKHRYREETLPEQVV